MNYTCQDCRVFMVLDKKNKRYICPKCYMMLYLRDRGDEYIEDEVLQLMRGLRHLHEPREVLPPGQPVIKNGNKNSKKHRSKDRLRKKTAKKLYEEL